MEVSKTKSSFYRRLYVAWLIDSQTASSVPALTDVTGMPRRTAQDTIAALANAVFIVAAFAGVSALHADSAVFIALQLAGCGYLLYMGGMFIRHAGSSALGPVAAEGAAPAPRGRGQWWRGLGMGLLSGLLNPKNALFYVSLASLVSADTSAGWKLFYGLWMFAAVLLWDLLVALAIGNQRVLRRFSQVLPWLERVCGAILILLALIVIGALALRL